MRPRPASAPPAERASPAPAREPAPAAARAMERTRLGGSPGPRANQRAASLGSSGPPLPHLPEVELPNKDTPPDISGEPIRRAESMPLSPQARGSRRHLSPNTQRRAWRGSAVGGDTQRASARVSEPEAEAEAETAESLARRRSGGLSISQRLSALVGQPGLHQTVGGKSAIQTRGDSARTGEENQPTRFASPWSKQGTAIGAYEEFVSPATATVPISAPDSLKVSPLPPPPQETARALHHVNSGDDLARGGVIPNSNPSPISP